MPVYTPEDMVDEKELSYVSSDPSVATVDAEGNVTAVSDHGTATITGTHVRRGLSATCTVTVAAPTPRAVQLSTDDLRLAPGETSTLQASVLPATADQTRTWKSSNTKVATVTSAGVVRGVAAGTATISAVAANGVEGTCAVQVGSHITKLEPLFTSLILQVGRSVGIPESQLLRVKYYPEDTVDIKEVVYSSSDESVATVKNSEYPDAHGLITPVGPGVAVITATHAGGKTAQCTVTVRDLPQPPAITGINTPTKQEIMAKADELPYDIRRAETYSTQPLRTAPYAAGKLDADSVENGLNAINFVRYEAGLPAVQYTDYYEQYTQSAAVVMEAEGVLSHSPHQSEGMDDGLYRLGLVGAFNSLVSRGFSTMPYAVIYAYMPDYASFNISSVGHRRSLLDPMAAYVGFGVSGQFTSVSCDTTPNLSDASYDYIAWPAKNMPEELYVSSGKTYPFSVTLSENYGRPLLQDVKVKLYSHKQDKTWNFSGANNTAGSFPYMNASGANTKWKYVVFDPGIMFDKGDTLDISITGLTTAKGAPTSISYSVNLFSLGARAPSSLTLAPDETGMLVGQTKTLQCTFTPSTGVDTSLTWSSSDDSIATVSQSGVVTAHAEGTAVITAASTLNPARTAQSTIHVSVPATAVNILDGEGKTLNNQTLPLDAGSQQNTLTLGAAVLPADASQEVTWVSSAPAVATVDKNGVVTGVKPGAATITATSNDGTKKSASVKVEVYYVDTATTLTASSDAPSIGLQNSYRAQMQVFGTDKTTPLDATLFEYSIPASQAATATVDENGVITAGEKVGTASVTATMKDDPLNRKVTLSVKVVALQSDSMVLKPELTDAVPYELTMFDADGNEVENEEDAASYSILLNKEDLGTASSNFTFTVDPVILGQGADGPVALHPGLSFATNNSKIAAAALAKDGSVTVTVKRAATAVGSCTITATTKDLAKVANTLTIVVADHTPILGTAKLTLNPMSDLGIDASLVPGYDTEITDVSVYEYNASSKTYDAPSNRMKAEYNDETDTMTLLPIGAPANATLKAEIEIACDNGRTYRLPLAVTIKNIVPAVTVKQPNKFNLFYKDSESFVLVTAKGAEITNLELEPIDGETFVGEYTSANALTVRYADEPEYDAKGKPYTKATLNIYLDGYRVPVKKAVTISTASVKPKLSLSASSSTINTALKGDKTSSFTVYDSTNKCSLQLNKDAVSTNATFATVSNDNLYVTLTLNGTTGGKANIFVQNDTWAQPVALAHTVKVQTTLPTAKLSTSTLKLSNIFTGALDYANITLSQANVLISDVTITSTAKAGSAAQVEAEKLDLSSRYGQIIAGIKSGETPKAGTYSFTATPVLADGTTLNPLNLKVSVAATMPKASLSAATVKLNNQYYGEESVVTNLKFNPASYNFDGVRVEPAANNTLTADDIQIEFDGFNQSLNVKLLKQVPKGTYAFTVTPTAVYGASKQEVAPVTLKVSVYSSTACKANVSATGKIESYNKNSAITYAVTKLTNITGTVDSVEVLGTDADLFTAELLPGRDAKGQQQVVLRLKSDADYVANKTYKISLGFHLEGIDSLQVPTATLSVKVA